MSEAYGGQAGIVKPVWVTQRVRMAPELRNETSKRRSLGPSLPLFRCVTTSFGGSAHGSAVHAAPQHRPSVSEDAIVTAGPAKRS